MEIAELSKQFPQQFANFTSKILQTEDIAQSAKYFFTTVKKEANWFGQKMVNLILKQPFDPEQQPILYFEKTMEMNQKAQYVPSQPLKYVLLSDVKMIARGVDSLTVAFLVEKKKIQQWNFIFYEKKLGEEWEMLLKDKKNQLKKIMVQKNQKENKIKDLLAKIEQLEKELSTFKVKCEQLLEEKENIQNENRNLYRQNITLIQQNSSLNETNTKYRRLLLKLENEKSFIQEKKRKSMPNKSENSLDSEEGIAIFYISQNRWKECLSKIQRVCSNIQETIQKSAENDKLLQLSEQLRLSVKSLTNSVIVLASKDLRKSSPTQRVQLC